MQVAVQLHVVQTWDAAVRLVLAVRCADGQRGYSRGEGLNEAEAQRLYIGSSLRWDSGHMMEGVEEVGHCYFKCAGVPRTKQK